MQSFDRSGEDSAATHVSKGKTRPGLGIWFLGNESLIDSILECFDRIEKLRRWGEGRDLTLSFVLFALAKTSWLP